MLIDCLYSKILKHTNIVHSIQFIIGDPDPGL